MEPTAVVVIDLVDEKTRHLRALVESWGWTNVHFIDPDTWHEATEIDSPGAFVVSERIRPETMDRILADLAVRFADVPIVRISSDRRIGVRKDSSGEDEDKFCA